MRNTADDLRPEAPGKPGSDSPTDLSGKGMTGFTGTDAEKDTSAEYQARTGSPPQSACQDPCDCLRPCLLGVCPVRGAPGLSLRGPGDRRGQPARPQPAPAALLLSLIRTLPSPRFAPPPPKPCLASTSFQAAACTRALQLLHALPSFALPEQLSTILISTLLLPPPPAALWSPLILLDPSPCAPPLPPQAKESFRTDIGKGTWAWAGYHLATTIATPAACEPGAPRALQPCPQLHARL
jgi:hypothetical protein